ncbi:MAG: EscU/YscU/HrcU family type III secretion system export apparatus switch protein [Paracoccaceae bacterium]
MLAATLGLTVFAATASLVWEKLQFDIIAIIETIHLPFEEATNIGLVLVGKMLIWTIIPVVAATIAAAFVILIIYNGGILFAIKPELPQLSRVSFKSGFKRIYGKRGWVGLNRPS